MAERVLVVQLERKHLLALSRVFEDRGNVVLTASSLKETGNLVQRYKPDLILLDVQMLGENWARAVPPMQRGAPNSRILLTSNGNRSPLRRQTKEFKQWGVIRPPFTDSKIEKALLSSSNGHGGGEGQTEVAGAGRGPRRGSGGGAGRRRRIAARDRVAHRGEWPLGETGEPGRKRGQP